jgi:hypothetical protein
MRPNRLAVLALLAATTFFPSCRTQQAGAVMVAMQTDMEVPKDITHVGVFVSYDGQIKLSTIVKVNGVGATGRKVQLPSTLAVVSSEEKPDARVRVRVMGFVGTGAENTDGESFRARVVRDSVFTIPKERRVLLRMPLQFVSDGSASESATRGQLNLLTAGKLGFRSDQIDDYTGLAAYKFTCPEGTTNILGDCVSAEVDAAALPDFREDEVFGGVPLDKAASGQCFDPKVVFADLTELSTVQPDCTIAVTSEQVNFAFGADLDGHCVAPGKCVVPMDGPGSATPFYTFETLNGARVAKFKSGVCTKLAGKVAVAYNPLVKTDRVPLCGGLVGPSGGTPNAPDGGAGDGGAGDGGTSRAVPRHCPALAVAGSDVVTPQALLSGLALSRDGRVYFVATIGPKLGPNVFAIKSALPSVPTSVQDQVFLDPELPASPALRFALASDPSRDSVVGIAALSGFPFAAVYGSNEVGPQAPNVRPSAVAFFPGSVPAEDAFVYSSRSGLTLSRLAAVGGAAVASGLLTGVEVPPPPADVGVTAMTTTSNVLYIGTAVGRIYSCPATVNGPPVCSPMTPAKVGPPIGAIAVSGDALFYTTTVQGDGRGSWVWRIPLVPPSGLPEPVAMSEGDDQALPVIHEYNGIAVSGNYVYYTRNSNQANVLRAGRLYYSHVRGDIELDKPFACPMGSADLLDPGAVAIDGNFVYVAYRGDSSVTAPGGDPATSGGIKRFPLQN